jgi:hypothetical protein
MADPKKIDSTTDEKSQTSGFNCCDRNFEDMLEKMQHFCCGTEKSFDCSAMMKGMFGDTFKKSQK